MADTRISNHAEGAVSRKVSALWHAGQFQAARIILAVFRPGEGVVAGELSDSEMWFKLQEFLQIGSSFVVPAQMAEGGNKGFVAVGEVWILTHEASAMAMGLFIISRDQISGCEYTVPHMRIRI